MIGTEGVTKKEYSVCTLLIMLTILDDPHDHSTLSVRLEHVVELLDLSTEVCPDDVIEEGFLEALSD